MERRYAEKRQMPMHEAQFTWEHALLLYDSYHWEGAMEYFGRVVRFGPESLKYNGFLNVGIIRCQLGMYREAWECFAKVLRINNRDPIACFLLGAACFHLQCYKEASECYIACFKILADLEVRDLDCNPLGLNFTLKMAEVMENIIMCQDYRSFQQYGKLSGSVQNRYNVFELHAGHLFKIQEIRPLEKPPLEPRTTLEVETQQRESKGQKPDSPVKKRFRTLLKRTRGQERTIPMEQYTVPTPAVDMKISSKAARVLGLPSPGRSSGSILSKATTNKDVDSIAALDLIEEEGGFDDEDGAGEQYPEGCGGLKEQIVLSPGPSRTAQELIAPGHGVTESARSVQADIEDTLEDPTPVPAAARRHILQALSSRFEKAGLPVPTQLQYQPSSEFELPIDLLQPPTIPPRHPARSSISKNDDASVYSDPGKTYRELIGDPDFEEDMVISLHSESSAMTLQPRTYTPLRPFLRLDTSNIQNIHAYRSSNLAGPAESPPMTTPSLLASGKSSATEPPWRATNATLDADMLLTSEDATQPDQPLHQPRREPAVVYPEGYSFQVGYKPQPPSDLMDLRYLDPKQRPESPDTEAFFPHLPKGPDKEEARKEAYRDMALQQLIGGQPPSTPAVRSISAVRRHTTPQYIVDDITASIEETQQGYTEMLSGTDDITLEPAQSDPEELAATRPIDAAQPVSDDSTLLRPIAYIPGLRIIKKADSLFQRTKTKLRRGKEAGKQGAQTFRGSMNSFQKRQLEGKSWKNV